MRRWRARQKRRLIAIGTVEVDEPFIDAAISAGFISEIDVGENQRLAQAVRAALREWRIARTRSDFRDGVTQVHRLSTIGFLPRGKPNAGNR